MPRSKTVTMAGQAYEVAQLNMRANKAWRDSLTEPVNKIIALMQNYKDIEIGSVADIAGIVALFNDVLLGSMDLLLDSLFAYAPALVADRERIEAEAYDDEAIAALGSILSLAFPLERLVSAWTGPAVTPTSTSLRLPSGGNGTKATAKQPATERIWFLLGSCASAGSTASRR